MTTGHPPGMLQDDSAALSRWLASKPEAPKLVREACAAMAKMSAERHMPDADHYREALAAIGRHLPEWDDWRPVRDLC